VVAGLEFLSSERKEPRGSIRIACQHKNDGVVGCWRGLGSRYSTSEDEAVVKRLRAFISLPGRDG
jgi:hypothetical protein